MAGVAIAVVDVDPVVDQDGGAAPAPSSVVARTASIPGIVGLPGGQGNPAVISIPRTQADPWTPTAVKAEKGYQRRSPAVTRVIGAGVPAPTIAGMAEPAPIVVGSPAPGVVTDPGPAIVVQPRPSTVPIGRPAHGDRGKPAAAIAGNIDPIAIAVQVLNTVNAGVYVAVGLGLHEPPVPV